MTDKEKARAYDEAVGVCRKLYNKAKANGYTALSEAYEQIFPELKKSEDEQNRKWILEYLYDGLRKSDEQFKGQFKCAIAWLEKQGKKELVTCPICGWEIEKQGEQKSAERQVIEPFEAEHGKYYYCIKDYFCGGKKQASKGDVVQALRGLPIMGLKDASEYFIPVNFIKCNSVWSKKDEKTLDYIIDYIEKQKNKDTIYTKRTEVLEGMIAWLKSLKDRYTWKPTEEQMDAVKSAALDVAKFSSRSEQLRLENEPYYKALVSLYNDLEKLREE